MMEEDAELVNEWCLDRDRLERVRVWYEPARAVVMVAGYGGQIGLRCGEALRLLSWLQRHQAALTDRATNWYDCAECGGVHPKSVVLCPLLVEGEGRTSSS